MNGPPGKEDRPGSPTEAISKSTADADLKLPSTIAQVGDTPAQLRRRRASSWRCPPLSCGRRDPIDPNPYHGKDLLPSDFGLTERELRRHARALYRDGWRTDEIVSVLAVEPVAP